MNFQTMDYNMAISTWYYDATEISTQITLDACITICNRDVCVKSTNSKCDKMTAFAYETN